MDETPILQLPLLRAGQAQKEITHNEALFRLDALTPGVAAGSAASPPGVSGLDTIWIIARGATGEWAGLDTQLAIDSPGGWRYCLPAEGQAVWDVSEARIMRYRAGQWQAAGTGSTSAIPVLPPSGGSTVDVEARACLTAILAVMRELKLTA